MFMPYFIYFIPPIHFCFIPHFIFLEENGEIAFLDTKLYDRDDKTIGHYIHRKKTNTNKYLNYESFHPQAHKKGVVRTLFTRDLRLCDEDHREDAINLTPSF